MVYQLNSVFSTVVLCVLLTACQSTSQDQSEPARPNILWITCEDISPNLGCYGDQFANTPHLDQLAREGVLYRNAFATAPVCAVARSTIISGLYASSLGTQHMRCSARKPVGIKFYPEYLREAGYYCTNNVKTDYNFDMNPKSIWDECSNTAHWRKRPEKNQPFFSIFNFTSSHESRVNNRDRYSQAIENVPKQFLKKPGEVPLPPYFPDVDSVRILWARYYNIITAMDIQVGKILEQLEEDGLADHTIVVFYSDHGAGIPRHKRWLYDSGLRVPLIVKMPQAYKSLLPHKEGTQTDEMVSFIDLPPTVLRLAGIPLPSFMQGRAFLGEGLADPREYIYAGRDRMDERYDMQRCVRDRRYKYIRYYEPYKPYCQYMNTPEKGAIMHSIRRAQSEGTLSEAGITMMADHKPAEELFDCIQDPDELNNLADDPAYSNILNRMRMAHAKWSDDTKDTGLIPETIIRTWESEKDKSIFEIMRSDAIPIKEIRETALQEISFDKMQERLSHSNEAVRYWAAIHLGNDLTALSDATMLEKALRDPVPVVRFAAARALSRRGQANLAIPVLERGLINQDQWVRLNAAQVLDELQELARPALPSLQEAMHDSNRYVVRVVNHSINQLLTTDNVVP